MYKQTWLTRTEAWPDYIYPPSGKKLKQQMKTILNWKRLMGKSPGKKLRANCSCHTKPMKCLTRSFQKLEWVLGRKLQCHSFLPSQILYINHNFSSWLKKLPLFCFVSGKPCRLSEANRMEGIQGFLFWWSSVQWFGGESASCYCLNTLCTFVCANIFLFVFTASNCLVVPTKVAAYLAMRFLLSVSKIKQ